ncbi:MAG TPA: peroxiredoxin-like family protein [Nannocystaceae bacterium]|nr:peroxiredoxin-like family protein [Nannocystaceae bacterium]
MAASVGAKVSAALADAMVLDREGKPSQLGQRWRDRPALLVFLRHFGCIGCAEQVGVIAPRVPELVALGIAVVFVGNGAAQFIDGFVERNGLAGQPIEIVTDPSCESFAALALERRKSAMLSPRAAANALRARLAGYGQTGIEGAGFQQGGIALVDTDGSLRYLHRDRTLGDHAPTSDVVDAVLALVARRSSAD